MGAPTVSTSYNHLLSLESAQLQSINKVFYSRVALLGVRTQIKLTSSAYLLICVFSVPSTFWIQAVNMRVIERNGTLGLLLYGIRKDRENQKMSTLT